MSDEAVTEERAPAPPAPATVTATPTNPAPATSSNSVLALQALIGNRATGRAVQRHEGTHPGPDGHSEADHPEAGRHRTVSALVGTEDPIAAIERVWGFGRALHADDQRLQSFSAIGWLQPWMFHPTESWLVTESHIVVQGNASGGFIRERSPLDPRPRGSGTVHIRLNNGRWMQLVLAMPGNTVFVRPASEVEGSFGNAPSVLIASLPGIDLDDAQVRRIERRLNPSSDPHAGELEEGEAEQGAEGGGESAAGDEAAGSDAGNGRPRARELTPPWAMEQVHAANLEAERRRGAAPPAQAGGGSDQPDPSERLPSRIISLPGQIARARRGSARVRAQQQRWETGRQLLDRLIGALDRLTLLPDRAEDPDVPETAPDWVRHQFSGARSLLEADRRRLLPLIDHDTGGGGADSPEVAQVEAEARQAVERRLLERAAGLPERFELDRGGRSPYAVHIRVGTRGARIRMQEQDAPSALYARVRGAAGQLATQLNRLSTEESTLIQGERPPYPIAIELMNSTTAVAGRPQWFRMEIDSGDEAPPRLAVTWQVSHVTGEGDDVVLGPTREAEHGAAADQRLDEMTIARREEALSDVGLAPTGNAAIDRIRTDQAMMATGGSIGTVADLGRWVIGHIAERSAERGVIFARPGRFVVSVIAQPLVDESDREHTGIAEGNIRAPSRTAISMDVVDTDERLDDLVEENLDEIEQRQQLLRQVEAVEAEIAQLEDDSEQLPVLQARLQQLQGQLAELEGQIDVARGRATATTFGYLGRKYDAAITQRNLVREIVANMGSGDETQQRHALLRYARQQEATHEAERQQAEGDNDSSEPASTEREPRIVLLYDQLHQRWSREINRGLERPPFAEWLTQQGDQLNQAADVASRQRSGLFARSRDLGRSTRLPAALITNEGRQLPLTLALHKTTQAAEGDRAGTTTYQLLDLSEVGAPDSSDSAPMYEGTAPGTDSEAAGAALQRVVMTYVNEAGYGYGQLVIHRPPTLTNDVDFAASQRFELRPSERERWIERLENIGIVVGMMGMIATGPVGIALGVIGAGTAATAAGLRMSQRSDRGTLDLDSETVQDVIDIATAPLAVAGAAANVRRMSRAAMLARLERSGVVLTGDAAANVIRGLPDTLNTLADADDIVGVLQAGQQVYALPSGLIDGLTQAQAIENPVERRAAMMEALASGAIALPGALHGLHGAHGTLGEMGEMRSRERRRRSQLSGPSETDGGGGTTSGHPHGHPAPDPAPGGHPPADTNAPPDATAHPTPDTSTSTDAGADTRIRPTTDTSTGTGTGTGTRPGTESTPSQDADAVGPASGSEAHALSHVLDNPTRTTGERALRSAEGLVRLRRQLKDMNLPREQHDAVASAIQTARTEIVEAHIASVLARVSQEHQELHIDIQNLGTQGLASDNDITVRVSPSVENPEHPRSETEQAAIDRRCVTVSLETVPLLYESLEAAGLSPERALDTNFYTELREDSFRPADAAEARSIAADQTIVSMTEVLLNVSPTEWAEFQRHQLAAIESDTQIPARDRAEMADRFRMEVEAAESTATRLLGEAGAQAHGLGVDPTQAAPSAGTESGTDPTDARRQARESALQDARRRLIDGLAQQPPLSTRDIRRLMADVKLLEPDALGTRSAVEGVVLGGQAMRGADLVSVEGSEVRDDIGRSRRPRRREAIEAGEGSVGPLRWDPETGDLVESSAEDELARRRQAAHPHISHRRAGDEQATGHDSWTRFLSAGQAIFGHLRHHIPGNGEIEPPHTATAAKNLHRVAELAARMGITRASGDGFSHLPDIIAAKRGDNAQERTMAALRAWASEPGVAEWASPGNLQQAGEAALMGAFLRWAATQGGIVVGQMRRRAGHTAVIEGAEMGSTATDVPVMRRGPSPPAAGPGAGSSDSVSVADLPGAGSTAAVAPADASGTPARNRSSDEGTTSSEGTAPTTGPARRSAPAATAGQSATAPHSSEGALAHLPEVRRGLRETFGREAPSRDIFVQARDDEHFRLRWIAGDPANRADKAPPAAYFDPESGTVHFPPHATLETIVHESLHVLTHDGFYAAMPIWLNEGITEILTERTTGSTSPDTAYTDNIEIARLLLDAVGEATVRAAYFDGDIAPLEAALDARTGTTGTLADLRLNLMMPRDGRVDSMILDDIRRRLRGQARPATRTVPTGVDPSERPTLPPPGRGSSNDV